MGTLLPGEVRHMGGRDAGGATAAAVGQVAVLRILHAFPVGSCCCLFVVHRPRYVLQQPPERISIRLATGQYLKEFGYVLLTEM